MEENEQNLQEKKAAPEKKPRRRNPLSRRYIHEVTAENDIKFRGPLSYRHLRIIAWVFLALSQIGVLLVLAEKVNGQPGMFDSWPSFLQFFGDLMAPLFLIAAFSTVLVAKDGYRRFITMYAGLSVLIVIAFVLVYQHFMVGLLDAISPDTGQNMAKLLLAAFSPSGFIAFNIFIDLLLCTLVTFFLNYNPKERFQGKKIYLFRLLVLIPILYEIASILLKVLCSTGVLLLSPFVFPFLTTKPPVAFLIFLFSALFVKRRERFFRKKGKSAEDFREFEKTNVNSFHFAFFLALIIFGAVILDLVLSIAISIGLTFTNPIPEAVDGGEYFLNIYQTVYSWGFGQTIPLFFIIPLILLFDYRKTYTNSLIDIIIPVAGVGLIAAIYIEGGFEILRIFLAKTGDKFGDLLSSSEELKKAFHETMRRIKP